MKRCDIRPKPCPCGIPWKDHDSPQQLRLHDEWRQAEYANFVRDLVRQEMADEPKRWLGWPRR